MADPLATVVVRVLVPLALVVISPPAPLSAPTLGLKLWRSSVPPLTVRAPVPIAFTLPTCSVPAETVVPPL